MHQKQPPAKIAVSVAAARVSCEPQARTIAARKAAVSAAQIDLAIMDLSSFGLAATIRSAGKAA